MKMDANRWHRKRVHLTKESVERLVTSENITDERVQQKGSKKKVSQALSDAMVI